MNQSADVSETETLPKNTLGTLKINSNDLSESNEVDKTKTKIEYLSPDKDKLFNFSANELLICSGEAPLLYNENLEHGTFIKLFDYKAL